MGKIDLNEIEQLETSVIKNPDWYYHGYNFAFTSDILKEGILARKYLSCDDEDGLNGKHYISIAKDIEGDKKALTRYKHQGSLAILDEKLKVIECKKSKFYELFRYTMLPFRYSSWSDEYQVFSKIKPKNIIGFECMAYLWAKEGNIALLRRLRAMIETMQHLQCDLPIYDFSRQEGDNVHEIDKEGYLELTKSFKDHDILSALGITL